MTLVDGVHHVAFLTANLDRLIAFYKRIFDAHTTFDRTDGGRRHAFIEIGDTTVLHPFEVLPRRFPVGSRCSSAGGSTTLRSTPPAKRRFSMSVAG